MPLLCKVDEGDAEAARAFIAELQCDPQPKKIHLYLRTRNTGEVVRAQVCGVQDERDDILLGIIVQDRMTSRAAPVSANPRSPRHFDSFDCGRNIRNTLRSLERTT